MDDFEFTLDGVKKMVRYHWSVDIIRLCCDRFSDTTPPPPEEIEILKYIIARTCDEELNHPVGARKFVEFRFVKNGRTLFELIPASFIEPAMTSLPIEIADELLNYIHTDGNEESPLYGLPSFLYCFVKSEDDKALVLLNLGARVDEETLRQKLVYVAADHDGPGIEPIASILYKWAETHSAERVFAMRTPDRDVSHKHSRVMTSIGDVTNKDELLREIFQFDDVKPELMHNAAVIKKVLTRGGTRKRRRKRPKKSLRISQTGRPHGYKKGNVYRRF